MQVNVEELTGLPSFRLLAHVGWNLQEHWTHVMEVKTFLLHFLQSALLIFEVVGAILEGQGRQYLVGAFIVVI